MSVKVGDKVPSITLKVSRETGGGEDVSTEALFKGKKAVLFAIPGAFTPTCSTKHLPGFVEKASELRAKGVDLVACISVNDAFVMGAWGKHHGALEKVTMLADGNGDFTRAMGLVLDGKPFGLGDRSKRYAAVIEDGVVKALDVEEPGKFEVSSVEAILKKL
jgi:peroxiredoxin